LDIGLGKKKKKWIKKKGTTTTMALRNENFCPLPYFSRKFEENFTTFLLFIKLFWIIKLCQNKNSIRCESMLQDKGNLEKCNIY
jgi:hypothetical protein